MESAGWLSTAQVAERMSVSGDAVRKRARSAFENGSDRVRQVPGGVDGGRLRWEIHSSLVDEWIGTLTTAPSDASIVEAEAAVGPTRSELDHLRSENELLRASLRHNEIVIQDLEVTGLTQQVASLQTALEASEAALSAAEQKNAALRDAMHKMVDGLA